MQSVVIDERFCGPPFPMIKAGLGFARDCRRVTVDGDNVDVVKQAA
jgi:hypothetical protein